MNVTPRAIEAERTLVVVVDASALAALLFGEPDAPSVSAALEGHALAAPTLLRYELASVYLKKVRRYAARRSALTDMLRAYPLLAIDEVQPAANDITRLAEDTDSTAYDAAYLWLAQLLGAPIVTLDRRLAEAARSLGLPWPRVSPAAEPSAAEHHGRADAGRLPLDHEVGRAS